MIRLSVVVIRLQHPWALGRLSNRLQAALEDLSLAELLGEEAAAISAEADISDHAGVTGFADARVADADGIAVLATSAPTISRDL